jgi:hypothetical protein
MYKLAQTTQVFQALNTANMKGARYEPERS